MSLTRKLLKDLELPDGAIERIIAAHVDTVSVLRQERDAALSANEAQLAETATIREEFAAFQTQVELEQHTSARRAALSEALTAQGANAAALPLLLDTLRLTEEDWDGDALQESAAAALQGCRAKYPGLFAQKRPLPVTRVSPPISGGGALLHSDVRRMTVADINRNWDAVQRALQGP